MFTKCHKIGIVVSDMARSVAFYRDKLGFEVVDTGESFEEEDEGLGVRDNHLRVTSLVSGDCHIELMRFLSPLGRSEAPKMNDVGRVHMAFAVDDIHSVYDRLVADGVHVISPPQKDESGFDNVNWMFFKDPDGILIEVDEGPMPD